MRIIAGRYKRRKLEQPTNQDIRPTSDKIRGALFNMLDAQGVIHDARILDAFCGTGALGLEALSRGATYCTFIDKDKTALNLARHNAKTLGASDACDFILQDASQIQISSQPYDLIFLDPPYRKDLISQTINALTHNNLLKNNTLIITEHEKGSKPVQNASLTVQSEKIYGDTQITILRYEPKTPE